MVLSTTAYPYSLDYLCKVKDTSYSFLKNSVILLAWYKLGSIDDIMNLPIGMIKRLAVALRDPKMAKTFRIMRGDTNVK